MYRFSGSIVQVLWSLNKSYLNYGDKTCISHSLICCFPTSVGQNFVPKKVNPGLIVLRKSITHTNTHTKVSKHRLVVTAVDVFGMKCSKLQFGLCTVSCALHIATLHTSYLLNNELEGKGHSESLPACMLVYPISLHVFM
jgi:hypothetical protein